MPRKNKKSRARTKSGEIPQILHFKPRNLAYILIGGKKKYLGKYDGITVTPEVEAERLRVWSEYIAVQKLDPSIGSVSQVTIAVLVDRFYSWAVETYRKNARSTGSAERFLRAVRSLLNLYAAKPAVDFSPLCLKTVRNVMIETERLCRKTINTRIGLIRQMFKYGVENELVPESTWRALTAVAGLKKGRSPAPDRPPVRPVRESVVEATLSYCSPMIADMVWLQRLTGMRPGEMLGMRKEDIYRDGDEFPEGYEFPPLEGCWVYIPEEHKTEHHNKIRFVILGRRCQSILTAYLIDVEEETGKYLFCPATAVRLANIERRSRRKTKLQPSQRDRRKEDPKRFPGQKYRVDSYCVAVQRAVERRNKAEIKAAEREGRPPKLLKKWFPNQLRHLKATEIRANVGIEAAQVVLGHSRLSTTEIYAEQVKKQAIDIALEWG